MGAAILIVIAIIMMICGLYIALYMVIWGVLSFFLPPGVREPVAVAVLVLGTVIVYWRSAAASTLLGRFAVTRLHKTRVRRLGLPPSPVRSVTPVRLAGVGGHKDRFDVSLIDRAPDKIVGGVSAGTLSAARDRNLYLVGTLYNLELWAHHRYVSFRHVLTFDLDHVQSTRFVEHDPDGLALRDDHARRYVGTLDIACPDRLHLYFFVRIKPVLDGEA